MLKISKVEVQKNHYNRVSVFVDDEYFASMLLDTAVKYGIKKDLEIDEAKLKEYIFESEKHSALNKASKYIDASYKTSKQMRDYLKKKGYDKLTIDYVIGKLKEYDYINDRKYAQVYIQTYETKYGVNMLKAKLLEKGVAKNIIEELLDNYESSNVAIDTILTKKIGCKPITQDLLAKTTRFLISRGFKYDEIKEAINRYKKNHEVNCDESWD